MDGIEIGDKYLIAWRNGQSQVGEIIEKRLSRRYRDSYSSSEERSASDYEYYVHFTGFDRRLDEWVTLDRIDLAAPLGTEDEHSSRTKRPGKRRLEDSSDGKKDLTKEATLQSMEKEHDEITKVKNIQSIILGRYEVETWYFSPFPEEYCGEDKMYICEFCLKYMKKMRTFQRHFEKCAMKRPPGREIYRDDGLRMYEVDGKDNKVYCQNLCLLSKLFLDHKTLYYDVDPFLFYVLCEADAAGSHIVGYFSKEKQSQENYNLACILTFPPYQRKGYGKFLISVSYELTKRENTTGSPEKPLSDLGKISYRSYWAFVLLTFLRDNPSLHEHLTLQDLAKMTGIRLEDILSTLHCLNLIKYWKGQHVISVSSRVIETQLLQAQRIRLCNPACLTWSPRDKSVAVPAKKGAAGGGSAP